MSSLGLLMKKVGCTSVYDQANNRVFVTLLSLQSNVVVSTKKTEDHDVVLISFGFNKNIKKPQMLYLEKLGVAKEKMGKMMQFRVPSGSAPELLSSFSVDHFSPGQFVDVVGTSIGKGFAGVMKRHNFKGLRASHGVSKAHRSPGSTGGCQDPGKVFKGKKMPGQMGNKRVTVQNLRAHAVYLEKGLLAVAGSVPGHTNSYVLVRNAIKKSGGLN